LALVDEISLEGTDKHTARELLAFVVKEAVAGAPSSYACEMQQYGSNQPFATAPDEQAKRKFASSKPRYFLVGNKRSPNDQVPMKQQNLLCAAVQGTKAARIKDTEAVKRRQAGWKDWGEQKESAVAREFQTHELKAIQELFLICLRNRTTLILLQSN
jgi:hypothetical protein